MRRLFERLFQIRPSEFLRVQVFFVHYTCIGMLYTFGATAGDSLFLSNVPREQVDALLAWVYVGIAIATVAAAWIFDRLQDRVPRALLIAGTQGALAATVVLFRIALPETGAASPWLYYGLIIWLEVCALLSITLFFSFAGDYFTTREAKRLYGYIAGGLALGNFLGGATVPWVVAAIGTANLLLVVAGLLGLVALISLGLRQIAHPIAQQDGGDGPRLAPTRAVVAHPHVRLLFVISLLGLACFVLVDYQMKISARGAYPETAALAAFFGRFYSAVGLTQLLFQFLVVGWLLRRFGIVACLMLMPVLHLVMASLFYATGHGLLAAHSLWIIAAASFLRMTVTETLEMPSRELALLPLPPRIRVRAQAMMSGMLAPLGQGVGGLIIVVAADLHLELYQLSLLVLVAAVLWLFALTRLRATHRDTLSRSLRDHVIDAADLEAFVRRDRAEPTLRELLTRDDVLLLRFTLDLLRGRALGSLAATVRALTKHDDPSVAVEALSLLGADSDGDHRETLERALAADRDDLVRAAAVGALCEHLGPSALVEHREWLDDEDRVIRHAALEGLARWGGHDGRSPLDDALAAMHASDDEDERIAAIELSALQGGAAVDRIIPALDHDSMRVAEAAVEAIGRLGLVDLVPRLLELAMHSGPRGLRRAVIAALRQMPAASVEPIAAATTQDLDPELRALLFHVLAGLDAPQGIQVLWQATRKATDPITRVAAGRELQRLALADAPPNVSVDELDECLEQLLEQLQLLERLQLEVGDGDVTTRMLHDRQWLEIERLFQVLSIAHDARALARVRFNLDSPRPELRANALELLEATLPSRLALDVTCRLEKALEPVAPGHRGLSDESVAALRSADPWLRVLTLPPDVWRPEEKALESLRQMVGELGRVPLFEDVPADALRRTAQTLRTIDLAPEDVLFEQGDPGGSTYLIRDGLLSIIINGNEVRRLGAGEVLGELAVLEGQPRSAGCVAVEPTGLLEISAEDFEQLIRGQSAAARAVMRTICARLRSRPPKAKPELVVKSEASDD